MVEKFKQKIEELQENLSELQAENKELGNELHRKILKLESVEIDFASKKELHDEAQGKLD